MTLFRQYARSAPPKTQAQILVEREANALMPADLQAMLDAARSERAASEANFSAGLTRGAVQVRGDEGGAK
jgi:hypothetical protein